MSQIKIAIVGEAWGREEARLGRPFVGATGFYLNQFCEEAGLLPPGSCQIINRDRNRRDEVYARAGIRLTNVFNFQPSSNNIETLCGVKQPGARPNPLRPGKYVLPQYNSEFARLESEIREWRPNIILGLGATALWYFTGNYQITKLRGAVAGVREGKFLATFHPSYLMRGAWHHRPVVIFDFLKAKRQSEFPEVRRPERFVYIPESIDDLQYAKREMQNCDRLSIDIETREDIVTCIGFSWNKSQALVIPLVDYRKPDNSYWSHNEEPEVWRFIQELCNLPAQKIFQNGLYDLHFLWRRCGITVTNPKHDTMLLHHSLYPEMQKGLGFLGSIYTEEPAWKMMRARGKGTIKREDE